MAEENVTSGDSQTSPPLIVSYKAKLGRIIDAVDKLRGFNVTLERITPRTIVVVGDKSSGKSSVLESLSGIRLPTGKCTRVPLIIQLRNHPDPVPEFHLFFENTVKNLEESKICEEICKATVEIAGNSDLISDVPMTLVVKKKGFLDVNLVDLPGIAHCPIGDQTVAIHDQISGIIMEYMKPKENIILNVISAETAFSSCESVCISQLVDTTRQRTLAVVTKCDIHPEGLLENVTTHAINSSIEYICVRNRIEKETFEEAQKKEATLFKDGKLSEIQKSMVGVPNLADKLANIQAGITSKCFPNMVKNIAERLKASEAEKNKLPCSLTIDKDATSAFIFQTVGLLKLALQKMVLQGEVGTYAGNQVKHCNARLAERFENLKMKLQSTLMFPENCFLVEEMKIVEEADGIWMPTFLPYSVFMRILHEKVGSISDLVINFVNDAWGGLEITYDKVLCDFCDIYTGLLPSLRKVTRKLLGETKLKFRERVEEMLDTERTTDFTCDPEYITCYRKLIHVCDSLFTNRPEPFDFEEFGVVKTHHLIDVSLDKFQKAFELKMKFTAYWRVVLKRILDNLGLQVRYYIEKVVNKELGEEVVKEVKENGDSIQNLLGEADLVVKKKVQLSRDIDLLRDSKTILEQIMNFGF